MNIEGMRRHVDWCRQQKASAEDSLAAYEDHRFRIWRGIGNQLVDFTEEDKGKLREIIQTMTNHIEEGEKLLDAWST